MKLKEVIKPEVDSAPSRTQVCPMPKLTLCYHCNKFPLSKVNEKRTQLCKSQTTRSRRGTRKGFLWSCFRKGFPWGTAGKESACNAGDLGLIPGLGRSPREGNGYPLQHSGHYTVHGVAKSRTQLSLSSLFGTQGSFLLPYCTVYTVTRGRYWSLVTWANQQALFFPLIFKMVTSWAKPYLWDFLYKYSIKSFTINF